MKSMCVLIEQVCQGVKCNARALRNPEDWVPRYINKTIAQTLINYNIQVNNINVQAHAYHTDTMFR